MSQIHIGIDDNTTFMYEGSPTHYGHGIWPTPFLSIASHFGTLDNWQRVPGICSLSSAVLLFREDYFDPVARVRRGRLYRRSANTSAEWHVSRHPAHGFSPPANAGYSDFVVSRSGIDGYSPKTLMTFESWFASEADLLNYRNYVLVLGDVSRPSMHTILDIERLASGEELITMRTRASIGVLPELMSQVIPQTYAALVMEQYKKAARAAFRDDADSVVDRCREAASAALNAALSSDLDAEKAKDLGALASAFDKAEKQVIGNAARILARLHARAKTTERQNNDTRPLTEGDAECALALLGIIYRELRWTHG
jgi:hypothetical protein